MTSEEVDQTSKKNKGCSAGNGDAQRPKGKREGTSTALLHTDEPSLLLGKKNNKVARPTTVQAEISLAASLPFLRGQTGAAQLHGFRIAGQRLNTECRLVQVRGRAS